MVKIRLTRTGRKHQPHYRIVVMDSRSKRDGKYIEKVGYYNPRTVPPTVQINKEILKKWMNNGAQLTDTVYDLLLREKIITKKDKLREKRIKLMIAQTKADKAKAAKGDESESTPKPEKPKDNSEDKAKVKKEPVKKAETHKEESKPKTEDKASKIKEKVKEPAPKKK